MISASALPDAVASGSLIPDIFDSRLITTTLGTLPKRMSDKGAAAPSSTPAVQESYEPTSGRATCRICRRKFSSKRGLSLHQRSAHPYIYTIGRISPL